MSDGREGAEREGGSRDREKLNYTQQIRIYTYHLAERDKNIFQYE